MSRHYESSSCDISSSDIPVLIQLFTSILMKDEISCRICITSLDGIVFRDKNLVS